MITLASCLAEEAGNNMVVADAAVDTFFNAQAIVETTHRSVREGATGWLGDARLDECLFWAGDVAADLDAVNIAADILDYDYNFPTIINTYYASADNSPFKRRVRSFLENNVGSEGLCVDDLVTLKTIVLKSCYQYYDGMTESIMDSRLLEYCGTTLPVFFGYLEAHYSRGV